jgi:hypothetical protein
MTTPYHFQGWVPYNGPSESPSQAPQPPERYESPAWANHEEDEDPEEREAAAQAAWEAEDVLDSADEEAPPEPQLPASQPAKLRGKPGPKPRAKPSPKPRAKPGPKPKPKAKAKEKRVNLTEEEHLTLFRLCNFHAQAYRSSDNASFWEVITTKFEEETGKKHSSLRRVVKSRISKRKSDIEGEGTGEVHNDTERSIQEDAWIQVVDEEDRLVADRKALAVSVAGESAAAETARESMMLSQTERARRESKVVRPRSRTPAWKAKETSGLLTDEEDIATASEDDDDPFAPLQQPRAPSTVRGSSSSRGRSRKRRKTSTQASDEGEEDRLESSFVKLAEAVAKTLAPAEEKEPGEALEQRLRAVIDEKLDSLKQNQLAMMTMLQKALGQPQQAATAEGGGSDLP